MSRRVAVVTGLRTPFCRAGGQFKDLTADDLGAYALKEAVALAGLRPDEVDEVVLGNVMQAPDGGGNTARVVAVKGGLAMSTPAITVSRNCASGLESLLLGANKIALGQADIVVAGGAEAMSQVPILFQPEMRSFLMRLSKSKGLWKRVRALLSVRPRFFKPTLPGLGDPLCGLNMGQTAEVLSRAFGISRGEQDAYALMSQQRAAKAQEQGRLADEIIPVALPPHRGQLQELDDGIRHDQTFEGLQKLKAAFERGTGTVTAGNASQVTDGAAMVVLMPEELAHARGLEPLGYIRASAAVALEPRRMGLGPVFAVAKLLHHAGVSWSDVELIEINEAFAAQVLAVEAAMASDAFAREELGLDAAVGEIDRSCLNVNGGAIALGHPLGASGTRLVITLLKELRRRGKNMGIATLCVGGGQGQAMLLEVQ